MRQSLLLTLPLLLIFAAPAGAEIVQLTTGEQLQGRVLSRDQAELVLEHAFLGQLVIPAERITAVHADDAPPAPQPVTPTDAVAVTPAEAEALGPGPTAQAADVEEVAPVEEPKQWKSQLELGLNAATGNTDKLDFRTVIRSVRETDEQRTKLEGSYFTAEADGDQTQNEFQASVLQDWYFGESPWLLNADATYEYDDFEAWDHRVSAHVGPGYKLIREEDLDVTLRSGVGALKEWGSDEDDVQFEGKVGAELTWRISENQTFNSHLTLFPSFSDVGEYRAVASADYTVKLDHADGLSLKIGLENEYESQTAGDAEHNDLKVFAALLMDF